MLILKYHSYSCTILLPALDKFFMLLKVLGRCESLRNKMIFCWSAAKLLKAGIIHKGYPAPKFPPGRSTLIILASFAATFENSSNVPPLAVPISRIYLGGFFFKKYNSDLISDFTCNGLSIV